MGHLNISKGDAVVWLKEQFMLSDDAPKKQKQSNINFGAVEITPEMQSFLDATEIEPKKVQEESKVDPIKKWDAMRTLSKIQEEYLTSRAIEYKLVNKYIRDNNGYVCCPLSDIE